MELESLIQSANALPPLPATVTRLITLLMDDRSSVRQIEATLSSDGPLAGRVLRMANSVSIAGRDQVGTVHAAVVRLGFGQILALAVAAGARKRLDVAMPEYGMAEGEMWKHSQAARLSVPVIAQYTPVTVPPETATAALLHDIGKIVLARKLSSGEKDWIHRAGGPNTATEIEILQVHHGELGGLIAQHWNLPGNIVLGIIYHHTPDACEAADNTVCHIVAVADWVSKAVRARLTVTEITEPSPASVQWCQINPASLEEIITTVAEQIGAW